MLSHDIPPQIFDMELPLYPTRKHSFPWKKGATGNAQLHSAQPGCIVSNTLYHNLSILQKTRVIIDSIFQVRSLYGYFIIFKNHYDFCIVLQGRVILEELVLSSPLSRMAIFNSALPRGYISQYTPLGKNWMFSVLGNTLVQEGNLERG